MSAIVDFFSQLIDFICGFIETIISFVSMVARAMVYMISIIASLPPYFMMAVLPIISVSIILFVLNRG